jgi:hypothetical protein
MPTPCENLPDAGLVNFTLMSDGKAAGGMRLAVAPTHGLPYALTLAHQ